MRDRLPELVNTPGAALSTAPEERKFKIVEEVKARLKAGRRAGQRHRRRARQHADGWWLLRASNTQAGPGRALRERQRGGLERLKSDLRAALAASGVELPSEASSHH
jgi:phosphomannomutase